MWSTWNGVIRKFNREVKKKDVVEKLNDMEIEIEKLQKELEGIKKKTIINDDGCPCTNNCCNHPQTEDKVTSEDDIYTVCHNCDAQCGCNN